MMQMEKHRAEPRNDMILSNPGMRIARMTINKFVNTNNR